MKLIPRSALLVLLFLLAHSSFASNGYFSHGYGTISKGLAGAGVALPLSTFTVATNPAGLILVGNRYDIGLAIFSPIRQYSVAENPSGFPGTFGLTPGAVKSSTNAFVVPSLGASWVMDDRSSIGAAVYGNGGMNTNYEAKTFLISSPTGVDLAQLFLNITYADFQRGVLLGSDNGAGFGWKDMTVVKFGVQYEGGGGWTWRGGFSSGKQPIEGSEVMFNYSCTDSH